MKTLLVLSLILNADVIFGKTVTIDSEKYLPTWESLDSRPLPEWYDKAKVGIFLHWGVYSVPGYGSEWFWEYWKGNNPAYTDYMDKNYPPGFSYQEFAKDFKAEFYDPDLWASLFQHSGARYVVLTSKHHEGYPMWPSTYSFGWNAMDVGPHRDLLGDLAQAVRKVGLRFGLYYSLYEWYNPRYLADKKSNFSVQDFVDHKMLPEMKEMIETYEPDVVWADGDWEAPDVYFKSKDFLTWLYNESPVQENVVVNDRWGMNIPCHHGGYYTCTDRFNPGVLQPHKWENCMTIDKESWGYRKNTTILDYLSPGDLIKTMVETVSCGGNILINVGPTKEGTIIPIFQERLQQLGMWLKLNGEAIYETVPWEAQNDTLGAIWYTARPAENIVYAILLEWPENNIAELGSSGQLFTTPDTSVSMGDTLLNWTLTDSKVSINLPEKEIRTNAPWGWVLKIKSFV